LDIVSTNQDKLELCELIWKYLCKIKFINEKYINYSEIEDENTQEITETVGDDDEESCVEEGCCLICEREMLLTKHHVIPKEVHEWYKKHHGMTKEQLHQGIMICRSCHSALHSFEDNKTLAESYSTIEAIRAHPKVQKWIPYVRKKKPISRCDVRTLKPNGNRDLPPSYDKYDN